jgi:hypothetical protein
VKATVVIVGGMILALSACTHHPPAITRTASPPIVDSPAGPSPILVLSDPGHVTGKIPSHCRASGSAPADVHQDPRCTPGGIDPAVRQATIKMTICVRGYTATVRPPVSETSRAKRALYLVYGLPLGQRSELDHLVPLELGGDNDVANLWPEAGPIPNPKDQVENRLRVAVCAGKVKLAVAQRAIVADWTTALAKTGA